MHSPAIRHTFVWALLCLASCGPRRLKIPTDHFLDDKRMDETSGIVASRTNPGFLYVHNDSGDSSRFFLISSGGRLHYIFYFNGDPALAPLQVKDCEDISAGPGPDSNASYVYMGDIGDNNGRRKYITVYRIKEPVLPDSVLSNSPPPHPTLSDTSSPAGPVPTAHLDADPLVLQYPDGARDAETLMVDPIDKLIYIVSKREDSVHVYSTPLNFKAHDTVTLTKNATLWFSGKGKWITAGDISADGDQVLLKSYRKVYYWHRPKDEPVWKTLLRSPTILPYIIEPQGEAIGFNLKGTGYYTVSEGANPELFYYSVPGL